MRQFIALYCIIFGLHCNADPRQIYDESSPGWLQAVGKLTVPGYRYRNGERQHHKQHCTATLVTKNIILSGWHCLENYTDLSQEITFTLPNAQPQVTRTAHRIAGGGGMHADWLILRLNQPVNMLKTVAVSATIADHEDTSSALTAAGYSRDTGLGAGGKYLSYHQGCGIIEQEPHRIATNCLAFKGASGGPVVYRQHIIGLVSAGDSESLSYFTPSSAFVSELRRHVR